MLVAVRIHDRKLRCSRVHGANNYRIAVFSAACPFLQRLFARFYIASTTTDIRGVLLRDLKWGGGHMQVPADFIIL